MKSDQASAFGFPNPMLGLVAYGIVICVGMSLLARARFPRWYWLTFNAGTLFGVGFCTWLQYQSLYDINALCLWCCLAWVATIIMFWYVTSFNVRNGFLPAPRWLKSFFGEFTWVLPVLHIGDHRHADPDPLVGLLDQLTRPPAPADVSGGDIGFLTWSPTCSPPQPKNARRRTPPAAPWRCGCARAPWTRWWASSTC